jgi:two-component system sensor histidine kinase RegB
LHLSGGITNPFVFLYLLQAVLGAVLLRPPATWIVVAATAMCAVGLALVDGPVTIPANPQRGLADPWVAGLLVCLALNAGLLVVFVGRIGRIIRSRDARLAALRQRAAEEEHIVRMGLLASGAAHELGTPLSTLSVILGDWRHLPTFASEPELLNDVEEMRTQVERCKSIVTGILLSSGNTRGEAPMETTVNRFLDELAAEWRATRPVQRFEYRNDFGADVAIVTDSGVRQMVGNVLDNALEASPEWLEMTAGRENGDLVVRVRDHGPGFSDAILAQLGTPYASSKGKPGGGLGLFLSLNVARTLGGTLTARNGDAGAEVTMRLPLSALTLEDDDRDRQS